MEEPAAKRHSAMALVIVTIAENVHSPKHHIEVMLQGELITPLLSAGEAASVLCCPAYATLLFPCPDQEGGEEMTEESWKAIKAGRGHAADKER